MSDVPHRSVSWRAGGDSGRGRSLEEVRWLQRDGSDEIGQAQGDRLASSAPKRESQRRGAGVGGGGSTHVSHAVVIGQLTMRPWGDGVKRGGILGYATSADQ